MLWLSQGLKAIACHDVVVLWLHGKLKLEVQQSNKISYMGQIHLFHGKGKALSSTAAHKSLTLD